MNKIGLFYGSNLGTTIEIAEKFKMSLNEKIEIHDIASSSKELFMQYNNLILGTSTWGYGDIQLDWKEFIKKNEDIDLNNKLISIFGLGDQDGHYDVFANGMGQLFDFVTSKGGKVIGYCSTESYNYGDETTAVRNDLFIGLPLDEVNQPDLTDTRIENWLNIITKEFNL